MPIPFTCPHCGEQTLADERYAGHEGPCVNCGWMVTVPGDAPRIAMRAPRPTVDAPPRDHAKVLLIAIASLALAATVIGLAALLLGPAFQAARTATLCHRCAGNLQQLALALDAYERSYGSYPPAYVVGPDGKPWHSWRVLLLPYLGSAENQLYQHYDMAQPWNSPHNMQLLTSMPSVFVSPADETAKAQYETSYVAVVGPGMALAGSVPTHSAQMADGKTATVVLVEIRGAGITWTEPRDLDGRNLTYRIGTDLGGNHAGGMNVVTADGESHFLPDTLTPEEVHALLTIAGGEDVVP